MMKRAAELVRKFPPAAIDQDAVELLANSLQAPRGARIENQIREAMGEALNEAASVRVIAAIKRLKLQPFEAPEPLPPIRVEEVELVCWMGVVA
jgi:hypothetical protein